MLATHLTNSKISDLCCESLAEILGIPKADIDPNATFSRLGLDSAMAVFLVVALEERLGVELSPEILFDHPTVAALSDYLAGVCSARAPAGR